MKSPYTGPGLDPPRSDVHLCDNCGQIALSEVGGAVPDRPFQVRPCDEVVAKAVMVS